MLPFRLRDVPGGAFRSNRNGPVAESVKHDSPDGAHGDGSTAATS